MYPVLERSESLKIWKFLSRLRLFVLKLWIDADYASFYPRSCCVTRYNWRDVKQTRITVYGAEIAVSRSWAWAARVHRTILRNRSIPNRIRISVKNAPITLKAKVSFLGSIYPRYAPPDSSTFALTFQTHRNCVATPTTLKRWSRIWTWPKVYSAGVQLVWKMYTNCCAIWCAAPSKVSSSA